MYIAFVLDSERVAWWYTGSDSFGNPQFVTRDTALGVNGIDTAKKGAAGFILIPAKILSEAECEELGRVTPLSLGMITYIKIA